MVEGRFGDVGRCTAIFGIYMNIHREILINLISHIFLLQLLDLIGNMLSSARTLMQICASH